MKLFFCNMSGALVCALSASVWADSDADFSMSGEIAAGLIHNSALSVDELDDVSKQSDSGQELKGSVNAKWQINDKAKVAGGYAYSQQRYNQFSQYDLSLHQFNLDGSYTLGHGELGVRYDHATAGLAGDTFLKFDQVSVYHGAFIQADTFVRTSVKYKSKSFTELSERNAQGFGAGADLFHFMNDAKTMLLIGVSAEKENSDSQQFDYRAAGLNTKITHKLDIFGHASKVGLSWRYQKKDYDPVTSTDLQGTTEIERDENRQVINLSWEVALLDNLSVKTELERGDYQSQIDTLTYQQNVAKLGLSYKF